MILQRLNEYYNRKQASPDAADHLPGFGVEETAIQFIIELDENGKLRGITDTSEWQGKKKVAQRFLVPLGAKKSVNIEANILWGSAEYVLGIPRLDTKAKQMSKVSLRHKAFQERIEALPDQQRNDVRIRSILSFLNTLDLKAIEGLPQWGEIKRTNPVMSFRVHPDVELTCEKLRLSSAGEDEGGQKAQCLVTGHEDVIERLHTSIKGVWGAQSSGASIVSFNADAFCSYGKEKGANASVGKTAAFAYITALKHLLSNNSRQRVQVGDSSTVFWAEQPNELETMVPDLFGEPPKDDPGRGAEALKALYQATRSGKFVKGQPGDKFHVLGLAPNAARISIRFWETATARDIAKRIEQHFEDLRVAHGPKDPEHLSLFRMLTGVAFQNKADNIPPNLGGDIMRSIIEDIPYPAALLNIAVERCRAEQNVSYARAAVLKAYLNRIIRRNNLNTSEPETQFTAMLDPANTNNAYRLGRLFAALERTQEEAHKPAKLNSTIRDRYYGAASSSPSTVFSSLLRLKNHHISKMPNRGTAVKLEKLFGDIMNGLDCFPGHLPLPEQARFALGYYHQRQDFFKGKTTTLDEPSNN
ncbi:MAG: type I-C CRISPR-associated protein Cas8c/Csd1 [Bacteroidetes bacterium]|nr:type I-C CRISPR-associated protein Cas8c/Csd1 [Bacteroidota bacterium]